MYVCVCIYVYIYIYIYTHKCGGESGVRSWPDQELSSPTGRAGYFACKGQVWALDGSQNQPPMRMLPERHLQISSRSHAEVKPRKPRRSRQAADSLNIARLGFSRARMSVFVCASFAWIRRLRKSPRYLLVVLHGNENDSLRKSPQNFHKKCAEKYRKSWLAKLPIARGKVSSWYLAAEHTAGMRMPALDTTCSTCHWLRLPRLLLCLLLWLFFAWSYPGFCRLAMSATHVETATQDGRYSEALYAQSPYKDHPY